MGLLGSLFNPHANDSSFVLRQGIIWRPGLAGCGKILPRCASSLGRRSLVAGALQTSFLMALRNIAQHMPHPSQQELVESIAAAARQAIQQLFREHPENFYYVTLITTGEALAPLLAAWSVEALALASAKSREVGAADLLKWSYADSPYCCYGESYFADVKRLFGLRPHMHEMAWETAGAAEHDFRLNAMESAMKQLDDEGLFGRGDARSRVLVAVEVMPPDRTNVERVHRLNPQGSAAALAWLQEAAEGE